MRITWQYQCILYYRKLQATLNTFNVEALNRFMPFTGEECSLETFLPRPFYAHINSLRRLSVYILLKTVPSVLVKGTYYLSNFIFKMFFLNLFINFYLCA